MTDDDDDDKVTKFMIIFLFCFLSVLWSCKNRGPNRIARAQVYCRCRWVCESSVMPNDAYETWTRNVIHEFCLLHAYFCEKTHWRGLKFVYCVYVVRSIHESKPFIYRCHKFRIIFFFFSSRLFIGIFRSFDRYLFLCNYLTVWVSECFSCGIGRHFGRNRRQSASSVVVVMFV